MQTKPLSSHATHMHAHGFTEVRCTVRMAKCERKPGQGVGVNKENDCKHPAVPKKKKKKAFEDLRM